MPSVYYTVYIDGEVYGGDRVTGISKGGSKPIIFDFIAEEGSHTITVRLDESDELSDPNTSNNVAQQTYVAESSGSSNLAIYLIVIALASVSAAVYYRYSRKEKRTSSKATIRRAPVVSEPSLSFPLVLNCVQCGSRVRVARPGSFRCPSCKEVSNVDSNGEIKYSDKPPETKVRRRPSTSSDESERPRLGSRRSRMEAFLSPDKSEDIEEEVEEKKLSASERLRQLREETELDSSEAVTEKSLDDEPNEVENTENAKEEKSKKRKDPPKGGSFGPTVGGF